MLASNAGAAPAKLKPPVAGALAFDPKLNPPLGGAAPSLLPLVAAPKLNPAF